MNDGAELIQAERARQISVENWTASHDDEHDHEELADAAVAYILDDLGFWPTRWSTSYWKPSNDRIRNLVRAGALIAAEIDRLQRQQFDHCEWEPVVNW